MARICYYDLLGVERSAGDSDLKKAYRKQALTWHPDKNHGNAEEATRIFAEIKEAYETLSDPQERAWYDNHREQILRGDDYMAAAADNDAYGQASKSSNVSYVSTESLMRFFSVSSFSAFDDSSTGFYTVYRQLFDTLRNEELEIFDPDTEYMVDQLQNLGFGDSFMVYDEDAAYAGGQSRSRKSKRSAGTGTTLRDFYNFWTTFSTRKSFGWFDRFRLSDAENRQIRRLMEKENKRLREKAKNEFVETVQKLAVWLRKRDPRYKRHIEAQKSIQQDQEKERKRRVAEQRAAVLESADSYVRQSWEIVEDSDDFDNYLSEFSSGDIEKSMDHSDAASDVYADDADIVDPENDLSCFICDKMFKSAAQKENHEQSKKHLKAARTIRREMLREERQMSKMDGGKKNAKIPVNDEIDSNTPDTEIEPDPYVTASDGLDTSDDGSEDAVLAQMMSTLGASETAKENRVKGECLSEHPDTLPNSEEPASDPLQAEPHVQASPDTAKDNGSQSKSKKELRRARQKNKTQNETVCNVCSKEFSSRNQLFNHIKDTGHALANNIPKHLAEQIAQDRSKMSKKGKRGKKH
ncbi:hypothetical protein EV178_000584 [Coemansia sp. RSA 1646]|nr:hypothetical protein EV178_000584 [Coemansia sp. RSA 1646]